MKSFFVRTSLRLQSPNLSIPLLRRAHCSSPAIVGCAQSESQGPVSLSSLQKKKSKVVMNHESDLKRVCENASESGIPKIAVKSKETAPREKKEISKNDLQSVEQVAIELLARRAFSIAELRKKLLAKKFPLDVVNNTITDLKTRGLVNDELYAETFSRSRWMSVTWGPRRIKQALIQKGISGAEVDKATKKIFEFDEDENMSDHNKEQTMSQSSMDHLYIQASKQWLRGSQDLSTESRKARITRWLQYRGFNWSVISVILKRLQSEYCNSADNDSSNIGSCTGIGGFKTKAKNGRLSNEKELSEEGMNKLFVEVSKQWIKGQDSPIQNRKAKIVRWLQYRGHKWDVVKDMLEKLQSKFPP